MVRMRELLERAQRENRVMAEMAALATSSQDYAETVFDLLNLIEQLVLSPFLSLSVQELGRVGQHVRVAEGVDPLWAEEAEQYLAGVQGQLLTHAPPHGFGTHYLTAPAAWFLAVPVETRGGRTGALALGAPEPLSITPDEEALMQRLARHVLLVLDHALLLEHIEQLEVTDGLTGVANQRRLLEILEYEMQRHKHSGQSLALLVLDVEGLDGINRSYGRSYGNHILQKLAAMLQQMVRPIDVVARCGLDEFAVVLPETDDEEALALAERLRERVQGLRFAGGTVDMSVGVAYVSPDETLMAESFLHRGEQALQQAKRQERGWNALWQRNVARM